MLKVKNLSKSINSKILFNDINLTLNPSDKLFISGKGGTGKTIFLRIIARLDNPDNGIISWKNDNDDIINYRSKIIYLHQSAVLLDGTVLSNLTFPFTLKQNKDLKFNKNNIISQLKLFDFDESFLLKSSATLSGSEIQITALLRALQLNPEILLLDEPTASLDKERKLVFENMVSSWVDNKPDKRAFIWVSHEEAQIKRVSNRRFNL